jgi:hypothetical protein
MTGRANANRCQITLIVVGSRQIGGDVDYAMLVKLYGAAPEAAKGRYSPADHVHVVLEFLREPIRQPSEPAHLHPHGEVLALGIGCADVLGIRVAFDPVLAGANALTAKHYLTDALSAKQGEKAYAHWAVS